MPGNCCLTIKVSNNVCVIHFTKEKLIWEASNDALKPRIGSIFWSHATQFKGGGWTIINVFIRKWLNFSYLQFAGLKHTQKFPRIMSKDWHSQSPHKHSGLHKNCQLTKNLNIPTNCWLGQLLSNRVKKGHPRRWRNNVMKSYISFLN